MCFMALADYLRVLISLEKSVSLTYSPVEETKKNEEECHRYFAGLSVEYI